MNLDLWLYGTKIATVEVPRRDRPRLRYTDAAVERWGLGSRILTVSAPIAPGQLTKTGTLAVLEGLLPEGDAQRQLSRLFDADSYELLAHIGRETLGAVTVLPADQEPPEPGPASTNPLSERDVAERLRGLPDRPLGVGPETRVRISLAGAQPKLLLHQTEGAYFDPSLANPSTVILKPETGLWPRVAALEGWGLEVMRAAGVAVPGWEITTFDGIPTLVIDRYDRRFTTEGVERVHQEDLCMALGVRPREKYAESRRSATTLAKLARVVSDNSDDPDADIDQFIRVLVGNIAIGNSDAHARNLGLVHPPAGGVRLTPAYDVIPTCHYQGVNPILAQPINGQPMRPETVTWEHLAGEVRGWRIPNTEDPLAESVIHVDRALREVGLPPDTPTLRRLVDDFDRLRP